MKKTDLLTQTPKHQTMSSFLYSSPPPSPHYFSPFDSSPHRSSPTISSPAARPPTRFVARPMMTSPTKAREARRQAYRDHMRQVRETSVFKARGGNERLVSDLLIAEHKHWMSALEKEGAQFLPSPEEEEALLNELQGLSSKDLEKPTRLDVIPNLQPQPPVDDMMLEDYLEAEAEQARLMEQSLNHYLELAHSTPDIQMED